MQNLTKLFCDLLSVGCTINQADASQIAQHVTTLAHTQLPDGFWVNPEDLEKHIAHLQNCHTKAMRRLVDDMKGSDFDIDAR